MQDYVKNKETFKTFKLVSTNEITEEKALEYQRSQGFDPNGYGFYRFISKFHKKLHYATWVCFTSCD